jgi:hypothetical protein
VDPRLRHVAAATGVGCGLEDRIPRAEAVDWEAFADLVERHRVTALVQRSRWPEAHGAPDWLRERAAAGARRTALGALRHVANLRETLAALETAEIPVVVLKGAALAADAYGDVGARDPGDLDLLVPPERLEPAGRALAASGLEWRGWGASWRPDADGTDGLSALAHADRLPMLKHAEFSGRGVFVELHWQLAGNRHLLPLRSEWLETPRRVHASGIEIPALPLMAAWWHALVHGSGHLWMRLKWLADVAGMAHRHPDLLAPEALHATTEAGLDRSVAAGLLTAERTFGPFLPDHARTWAARAPGTGPLVRGSLAALARPVVDSGSVSPRALPRYAAQRLALRGDFRYRAEEVRRMLLEAAREWNEPDPGVRVLARGPRRWVARHAGSVRTRISRR